MKRIVTHMLVAAGLAIGACGVAQAHTDLHIGLSLGAPARVYVPQPAYYGYGRPDWDHRPYYHDRWDHRHWGRGGYGRHDYGRRW